MRPYTGCCSATVCPVETLIKATPASLSAPAMAMISGSSRPPGAQSRAEMRTERGLSAGHTARTASKHLERKPQPVGDRSAILIGARGW